MGRFCEIPRTSQPEAQRGRGDGSVLRDVAVHRTPRPSGICSGNIEKTSQNLSYNNMVFVHNIGPVDAEMGSVLRDTADIAAPRPSGICSGNIETSQNLSYNNTISVAWASGRGDGECSAGYRGHRSSEAQRYM
ncbi:hypothetical protein J6590_012944 [Homalodisca vitripennis]|nr:hypothetical protein J6590_093583 [Homalodisca vitripennis]KAG8322951.1 hypothetical protein J6590_012944 [Homalodisca vitripennis]